MSSLSSSELVSNSNTVSQYVKECAQPVVDHFKKWGKVYLVTAVVAAASLGIAYMAYTYAPEPIPVHYRTARIDMSEDGSQLGNSAGIEMVDASPLDNPNASFVMRKLKLYIQNKAQSGFSLPTVNLRHLMRRNTLD